MRSVGIGEAFVFLSTLAGLAQAQASAPPAFTHTADGVVYTDFGGPVVYDNGTTDPNVDSGNEMSEWVQADDFELTGATSIGGAEVDWFDINTGNQWDGGIEWFLFTDAGGSPGALVDTGTGSVTNSSLISNANGWDWFTTSFAFDHSVPLAANTRYWFGLHWAGDHDFTRDDVYFAYSQETHFNTSQESDLGTFDNWVDVTARDRGFRLLTVPVGVPAMSKSGLFVLGAGLLVALLLVTRKAGTAAPTA
jgi:hypothetical protein